MARLLVMMPALERLPARMPVARGVLPLDPLTCLLILIAEAQTRQGAFFQRTDAMFPTNLVGKV